MGITFIAAMLSWLAAASLVVSSAHASGTQAQEERAEMPQLLPAAPERTLDVPTDEVSAQFSPAEVPPPDFTAAQYIDSQGCVFVRMDQGWRARIARDGSVICGYPPTFSARRTAPDDVAALFPDREEPRAQRIERVLTETILPNLHDGELAEPQAGETGPHGATQPAGPVAQPSAPAAAATAETSATPPAADPLGFAAAVAHAPVMADAQPRRQDRLCDLIGAKATPTSGVGGSSALGLCGGAAAALPTSLATKAPPGTEKTPAGTTGHDAAREQTLASAPATGPAGHSDAGGGTTALVKAAGAGGSRKSEPSGSSRTRAAAGKSAKPAQTTTSRRGAGTAKASAGGAPMIPPGARYVQIGAFRNAENAARTARRLNGMGLPVVRAQQRGTQLIMVGPLSGREAIVRTIDRVRQAGYRDAYARR